MSAAAAPNPFTSDVGQSTQSAAPPQPSQEAPNPFASPAPQDAQATQQAAPPPAHTIGPNTSHGALNWLTQLEGDLRNGTGNTFIGKALKAMGAQGLNRGAQASTGDFMGSAPLGAVHAAQGVAEMPQHPVKGAWDAVKGVGEAMTMPAAVEAPETAEGVASGLEKASDYISGKAGSVVDAAKNFAQKFYVPGAVKDAAAAGQDADTIAKAQRTAQEINSSALPELHQNVGAVIDKANTAIGVDTSGVPALSDKLAQGAQAYKTEAQKLYQQADAIAEKATGQKGNFQRLGQSVEDAKAYLRNPALTNDEIVAGTERLNNAQAALDQYNTIAKQHGIDVDKLTGEANKKYSTGLSMEEFGRGVNKQEDLAGNLKPSLRPLDAPVKANTANIAKRGHVLANAVGEEGANDIVNAANNASQKIAAARAESQSAKKTVQAGKEAQQRIDRVRKTQWNLAKTGALGAGGALGVKKASDVLSGH